jgi:hypothetical protein
LSTRIHNPKPLNFQYEKPLIMDDLDDTSNLYMKIVRGKESVDYLKKLMEKKGSIKTPKNPLVGTRFK